MMTGYKTDNSEVRINLDEVSFIRPLLILLVVLYHSMAIHTGNWEMPDGCSIVPAYKAVGRLTYSFMLEAFVFVSGYVWAFQREKRGRLDGIVMLCRKKAIRLLIPTIVFGILYFVLFEDGKLTVLHLLEGPGHLWFLPMLFECFIISWLIIQSRLSLRFVLPLLFIVGIITPSNLPFRLSLTLYYLPFFFLGYMMIDMYERLVKGLRIGHIITVWSLYVFLYFSMVECRSWLVANVHQPVLLGGGKLLSMMVYSVIGTIALFLTSIYLTKEKKLPAWYYRLGSLCMGVYIFNQFILEIIYYHSGIPSKVPNMLLPIVGFVLTLAISIALTYLLRKTKVGKLLM